MSFASMHNDYLDYDRYMGAFSEGTENPELDKAIELLRCEHMLGKFGEVPWNCADKECVFFDGPMIKSCGCYKEKRKLHDAQVETMLLTYGG